MKRNGFVLVGSLLVLSLLMVLGLAMLGSRATQYEAAALTGLQAEARAIARAGMEATRAKLYKDLNFPPLAESDSSPFEFSENVTDFDGTILGNYVVRVDRKWRNSPYQVLVISSLGRRKDTNAAVLLMAELDVSPTLRTAPGPNPDYFQWIAWSEDGVYSAP
jgi:hypothetical protein